MTSLVIKGGTIVDRDGTRSGDVRIVDGLIDAVGPDLDGERVLDAGQCVVAPGLVDLGAHGGEPGHEEAETMQTMARAAAAGGFTAVVALPETDPVIDNASVARDVLRLADGAPCEVLVSGALTVGRNGLALAPIGEMHAAGVRIFTDGDRYISDAGLMRRILDYSRAFDVVVAHHSADAGLAANGHMHEGEWSSRLGIPGEPAEAEEVAVMRDIALARLTGARLHFRHLSTRASLGMVRAAKAGGLAVSAGVAPHHLALTDADVASYDPALKVRPPLRPAADVASVIEAVIDGTIDAIVSDHRPHVTEAKEQMFDEAPPGSISLETSLAAALTYIDAPIERILAAISWRPAEIAGVHDRHGHRIADGVPANICVIDPNEAWTPRDRPTYSRSQNCAFAGRKLTGKVRHTVFRGDPVVIDGECVT